jgi:predicted nucleic acid-binding protein
MTTVVVDSSIVIKWFVPETDRQLARVLHDRMVDSGWRLFAPNMLLVEVANLLWKNRYRHSEEEALSLIHAVESSGIEFVATESLVAGAHRVARLHNRSVYDTLYIALAHEHNCDYVTADERLFKVMETVEPCVKLLDTYEL